MEDIDWWVWLIIGIAIVALLAVLVAAARKASSSKRKKAEVHDRTHAAKIREDARESAIEAKRREAAALSAKADAAELRLEADRREAVAQENQGAAERTHDRVAEQFSEADRIDPDAEANTDRR